eukprot:jgi/Ulvmu1/4518/UM002_0244.1
METPGEPKRTPPKPWTPNYLKGTSSHQSRVTAPTVKAKENIDAVDLFTRHDEKRSGRFTVPNGATTPPRSRAPTPPPATSHFAVSTKPIEELEPLDDSWDRVRVFIRVRPALDANAETAGATQLIGSDLQKISVQRADGNIAESKFMFDRILPPDADQQDVYNESVRPIVDDVLLGYNGSVMAYGQTGAGKTYTLSNMEPDAIGMTPRALADIFNKSAIDVVNETRVFMSYCQIYMEVIKDLLMPSTEQLQIREDLEGVFLSNVHEVEVRSTKDCLALLQRGDQNRIFASTEMNAHSSRSHAIVIVTVIKRRKRAMTRNENGEQVTGQATTMGRMFMVDLAGSERLKKSKSVGLRAQEAKAINLSLTTLGMCVNAKSDPTSTHIPFRDSKLTRLLQESLGGNAKTSMLIAISDAREHADETFQSLLFGSRAILVKTAPRVNQYFDLSALNERIANSLQEEKPETALERALVDREETVSRLERELERERLQGKSKTSTLQRRLEEALQQGQSATREQETSRMALAAAQMAHDQQMREAEKQKVLLRGEMAKMQAHIDEVNEIAKSRQGEITSLRAQLQARTDQAERAEERVEKLEKLLQRARADAEQQREAARAAEVKAANERTTAETQRRRTQDSHEESVATLRSESAALVRRVTEQYETKVSDLSRRLDGTTEHAQEAELERDELAQRLKNTAVERESFAQLAEELQAEVDAVTQAAAVERDSLNGAISSASDSNAALLQQLKQAREQIVDLEGSLQEARGFAQAQAATMADREQKHISALVRAGDHRRRSTAAISIQRTWRRYQQRQMQSEHMHQRRGWQRERQQMSAEQHRAAAQTGQALVRSTVKRVEETMNLLLMEMLLPKKVKQKVYDAQVQAGLQPRGTPGSKTTELLSPRPPVITPPTSSSHSTTRKLAALLPGRTTPLNGHAL